MRYRKGVAEVGGHARVSQKVVIPKLQRWSTKLGTTLELLKWKAETGLSDKGFEKLLKIMKPKLPKDNELPETTYEAKKLSAL